MYDRSTNSAVGAAGGAANSPLILELAAGPNRVVVDVARGGRLASWTLDGEELLLGAPDASDTSIRWGCFLMAPWPGRLAGARFEWGGRTVRVPRTFGRNAIHGLTWNRPWTVERAAVDAATLAIELPLDAWPMGGRVQQQVTVTPGGVRLNAEIEAGAEPMPAALGWHPWFLRRGDPRLRVAASEYQVTERMLPTGRSMPVHGKRDLRAGPRLGRRRLDLAYLHARSPAVVSWPDLELRIAFEPSPAPLVVYTPRAVFCVEPLTAAPNSFALANLANPAAGGVELAARGRLRASVSMTISR